MNKELICERCNVKIQDECWGCSKNLSDSIACIKSPVEGFRLHYCNVKCFLKAHGARTSHARWRKINGKLNSLE